MCSPALPLLCTSTSFLGNRVEALLMLLLFMQELPANFFGQTHNATSGGDTLMPCLRPVSPPLLWKRWHQPQSMTTKQQSPTTSLALLVGMLLHGGDMHSKGTQGNQ